MKTFMALLTITFIAFFACGCGSNGNLPDPEINQTPSKGQSYGCQVQDSSKCDILITKSIECFTEYCKKASNGFCDCWGQGLDLYLGCKCVTRNWCTLCQILNLDTVDPETLDCSVVEDLTDGMIEFYCPKEL